MLFLLRLLLCCFKILMPAPVRARCPAAVLYLSQSQAAWAPLMISGMVYVESNGTVIGVTSGPKPPPKEEETETPCMPAVMVVLLFLLVGALVMMVALLSFMLIADRCNFGGCKPWGAKATRVTPADEVRQTVFRRAIQGSFSLFLKSASPTRQKSQMGTRSSSVLRGE